MRNKSLGAVISGYEKCAELSCSGCPYLRSEDPKLCDPSDKDDDALYYLKEYKTEQDHLAKEIEYYQKKNDQMLMVCDALQDRLDKTKDLVHCKDCKYYAEDVFLQTGAISFIAGHHMCSKWGHGCQTEPEGFCHMGEK